jgi:hypothetical protein
MGDVNYLSRLNTKIDSLFLIVTELKHFSKEVKRSLTKLKLSTSERIFILEVLNAIYELRLFYLNKVSTLSQARIDFLQRTL